MKNKLFIAGIATLLTFGSVLFASAAPSGIFLRTIWPETTNTYDLGSGANVWNKAYIKDITISGTCTGCGGGGTLATSSQLTAGKLVQSTGWNTVANIATSTLGLLTTDVAEGSNLYYTLNRWASAMAGTTTDALAQGVTNKYWSQTLFDNALTATTTLPALTTLANLATVGTITSGVWHGTAIADAYVASASTWNAKLSALTGNPLTKGYFLIGDDSGNSQATSTIFISSKGYVGIGTTNPLANLQVVGATSYAGLNVQEILTDTTTFAKGVGGQLAFEGRYQTAAGYANFASVGGFKENVTDGDYAGYLGFYTRPSGQLPTEKMRITSTGNVGIGTTSPAGILDILGSTVIQGVNIRAGGASGQYPFRVTHGGPSATNGSYFAIDNNGNVGIGTTNPLVKLDVSGGAGGLPATSGSTPTALLSMENTSSVSSLYFGTDNNSPYGSWLQAANSNALGTYEPLNLNPRGGNVGIGTTTPSQKLDVNGSINIEGNNGIIMKDTVTGTCYMVQITSGVLTPSAHACQ